MTTIPLTMMLFEGPIGRAYLAHARAAGFRFERLILLVGKNHPATGKPLGRWMPGALRTAYAERVQEAAYNHWPRRIAKEHPQLVGAIEDACRVFCPESSALLSEMRGSINLEDYTERLERVPIVDLRDPALEETLRSLGPTSVLYSGGGIVPPSLLRIPALRFLHVHPGYLPHVRGADGVLWSVLVRGCAGASCFFMAEGIDTGDVLARREYPALHFALSGRARPDAQTLYRAAFSFFDPLLRSTLLVALLRETRGDLESVAAEHQDLSAGTLYHFMHRELRAATLGSLFDEQSS